MCARILVIDDDPVNVDLISYLLNAFGHDPARAFSAEEALSMARRQPFDLILCDIQMPEADGYEFLRRLKGEGLDTMPVVGVTALAMVGDHERIVQAGFNGYLAKPIAPDTFVSDIEKFLSPENAGIAPVVAAQESTPPESRRRTAAPRARILVVDNARENRDLLRRIFEYGGYEVMLASGGEEAFRIAKANRPDAIVSDVHMPAGDGLDLLRVVREDADLRNIRFVLISSSAGSPRVLDLIEQSGSDRFVVRPIDPQHLLEALDEYFPEQEGTS